MQQVSQRTLRLSLSGSLLALLVLLTFNVGTTHAQPNPDCSTPVVATNGNSASCTIGAAMTAGAGDLTVSADPNLTVTNGTPGPGINAGTLTNTAGNPYTYTLNGGSQVFNVAFNSTVTDGRGSNTGWILDASTTGFPANSTMQLTGVIPSCTSTCFPLAKDLSKSFPTLSDTPQPFVSAPPSGPAVNGGTYTIATTGALILPGNLAAGTNITGSVILTLFNGFID